MDQQLEAKATDLLVKMIDVTVQSVSDVVEFGKQQIPEVIHQLLMWKAFEAIIWVVIAIVFSVFLCTYVNRVKPRLNEAEYGFGTFVQMFGWLVAIIVGGVVFINNLMAAAYILIAPKVWLIEYAAQVLKK